MDTRTRTLTFGDDGSPGADVAWDWIVAHSWPQWAVEVVTVTLPKSRTVTSPLGYTRLRPWDPPEPRQAPDSCGFRSVTYLAADNDPRLILGHRSESDLVVVGPRGRGLLKALHLGSTAEWLLHCPSTPLLIARPPVTTRSIMMCVDGSHHARAAVDFLASLPWIAGVSITVLGVVEADDDLAATVTAAADLLMAAGADVTPIVVEPDPMALAINPRLTIFEYMDAQNPDLVVLGTSGLTGLSRMWVGSVASAVSRHAHCSVLVVRDPQEGDG
jgi:nucleotide-binding universal stress UspA family protein